MPVTVLFREWRIWMLCAMLVGLLCMTVLWKIQPDSVEIVSERIRSICSMEISYISFAVIVSLYIAGGLVSFPVVVLIPATAMLLGPVHGLYCSMAGLIASAAVLYAAGYGMGNFSGNMIRRDKIASLAERMSTRSMLAVITLRLLPIAPYSVVNFAAGVFKIPFSIYVVGTAIGILPAAVIMTAAGCGLGSLVQRQVNIAILLAPAAGIIISVLVCMLILRRRRNAVRD